MRLDVIEEPGMMVESSEDRMETFSSFKSPKCKQDIINMLGDQSGKRYVVFRENGGKEVVKTIAVGT